jgi:PadR family transcriptional regulator, regulatory protein PadR
MDGTELLPATLDLLIMNAVSLGSLHSYGVLLRIQRITRDTLRIPRAPFTLCSTAWKPRS